MEGLDLSASEPRTEEEKGPPLLGSGDPAGARASPSESSSGQRRRRRRLILLISLALLVLVVIVTLVAGILWRRSQRQQLLHWQGSGTTDSISEIILGRCFTYTRLKRPELRDKNCPEIWNAFKTAFLFKDQCNITEADYQPLEKLANQTLPCNKFLYWSKTYTLVHQYTMVEQDMFTLEDTLLGYMADGLDWCGDPGSSAMNHQSCPHWKKDCSNNPKSAFWKMASKWFAEAACGVVHVMLNGSTGKAAFQHTSTFGSVEIPNLHPDRVPLLEAWVMHDIGGNSSDSCSGASIHELRSLLNKRNIILMCEDDYKPAKLVQCVSHSEHSSCALT
ncbi:ADP-ribosyl cyclase/cyclic ADP-ribose hydrolase 1 isoform X2 [Tenrec ecaudatus]|uniref:ADP-ribosyl cyclase/cyclic ADP-ribose hydrolase 1 isoform X2 n=1 Tax=Tenrec ecaudatus TaxID=94439 RepID=UPI003F59EA51